ncbi:MAG: T9SS type A sorting domain-containing protein [candidate division WOR-3 bacterium]
MPRIQAMFDEYGSQGYLPLAINLWQDMENVVKVYARAYSYPFFRDAGAGWTAYRMNGYIPLNYVIDTAGVVVGSMEGFNEAVIRSWIEPYLTAVSEEKPTMRPEFNQVAPNPANRNQTIRFSLPETRTITLKVFSASGKLVGTLVEGNLPAGVHSAVWHTTDENHRLVPNGLYFYELNDGRYIIRYKTAVLR